MKSLVLAFMVLSLVVFVQSCKKGDDVLAHYTDTVICNEADDNLNTYDQKIKTILNINCATSGCHSSSSHEEGRDYSSYSAAKSAMDGSAFCTINHGSGCKSMPRNAAKLSDADIHDLTCWAKNNYPL